MMQIRTIKEAYEEIKKADPKTAITQHAIRRLILSGSIPYIKSGNKYLVNMDILNEYLANPHIEVNREYGIIRRISER